MYIGNGKKFGAHTAKVPLPDQVSVKSYSSNEAISACRPLNVYLKGN